MDVYVMNLGDIDPIETEIKDVLKYQLFNPFTHGEGDGIFVELDFLLKKFSAVDENGSDLTTPCPSYSQEWAKAAEMSLKDIVSGEQGVPAKVWLPGSARPLFCYKGDYQGGFYFACACKGCCKDNDLEIIRHVLEFLEEETDATLEDFMSYSDDVRELVDARKSLTSKFDKKMLHIGEKYFPDSSVSLYTTVNFPFLPGSFEVADHYAASPSMVSSDFKGELLLQSVVDFQLAATLFDDQKNIFLMLPHIPSDLDIQDCPDHARDILADILNEERDTRFAAERFFIALSSKGVVR